MKILAGWGWYFWFIYFLKAARLLLINTGRFTLLIFTGFWRKNRDKLILETRVHIGLFLRAVQFKIKSSLSLSHSLSLSQFI